MKYKLKFNYTKSLCISLGLVVLSSGLTACAPLLIGGAIGTAAAVYTDRRPANLQTTDKGIQIETLSEISRDFPNSNIEAAVWNRRVLLIGSVPTQEDKDRITEKYSKHKNISALYNELNVGFKPALVTKGNDALLTSRLRTEFTATQGINSSSIKIVTEGNKVYLMGWVTQAELEKALTTARQTSGVSEVVNLTEVVSKN